MKKKIHLQKDLKITPYLPIGSLSTASYYDAGIFYENTLIKIAYRVIKSRYLVTGLQSQQCSKVSHEITRSQSLFWNLRAFQLLPTLLPSKCSPIYPQQTVTTRQRWKLGQNCTSWASTKVLLAFLSFMCGGSFNRPIWKFPFLCSRHYRRLLLQIWKSSKEMVAIDKN